jgi:hypothetical protein
MEYDVAINRAKALLEWKRIETLSGTAPSLRFFSDQTFDVAEFPFFRLLHTRLFASLTSSSNRPLLAI